MQITTTHEGQTVTFGFSEHPITAIEDIKIDFHCDAQHKIRAEADFLGQGCTDLILGLIRVKQRGKFGVIKITLDTESMTAKKKCDVKVHFGIPYPRNFEPSELRENLRQVIKMHFPDANFVESAVKSQPIGGWAMAFASRPA